MAITIDELKGALPPALRKGVNQELLDHLHSTINDPEALANYTENIISYTSVLREGKFKLISYLNAVRYVSFKLRNMTNQDAYIKTFPLKYKDFLARGVSSKDIASYISAYNKGKLVQLIFEQTMIPVHVLNAPMYQQALNVQCDLMLNARSEKVRSDAANSVLTQLRPPEVKKLELDIGVKEDSSIDALRASTLELVEQQKQLISSGASAQQIAHTPLVIEAEVVDAD